LGKALKAEQAPAERERKAGDGSRRGFGFGDLNLKKKGGEVRAEQIKKGKKEYQRRIDTSIRVSACLEGVATERVTAGHRYE